MEIQCHPRFRRRRNPRGSDWFPPRARSRPAVHRRRHRSAAAQDLHRIDEAFARRDFESHGFKFVTQSDVLRKPDDARDLISYKPPMLGRTDRFVYVFRKPGV